MNSPTIQIFGIANWDRGAKARWLLTELGIPYQNNFIDREKNGFESPELLAVNPLGRIPAARIGDRPMAESSGICQYLADQHLDKGLAPALNAPERLEYNQWMYFAATSLDGFQTRIQIIEELTDPETLKSKMDGLLSDANDAFQYLNTIFAKNQYIVANRFSAADVCLAYHLYWLPMWPEFKDLLDKAPNLAAYLKRMQERPAAIKSEVFSFEE